METQSRTSGDGAAAPDPAPGSSSPAAPTTDDDTRDRDALDAEGATRPGQDGSNRPTGRRKADRAQINAWKNEGGRGPSARS